VTLGPLLRGIKTPQFSRRLRPLHLSPATFILRYLIHPDQGQVEYRSLKMITIFIKLLLVLPTISSVLATDITGNPSLDASLFTAATQLDRLNQLSSDSDWLFDFTAQPSYSYSPGSVVNADAATFPASVGNGMTLAMLNLGPCAMLPPHYHPRATNMVVAVAGTTNTYMIEENGARMVSETLTTGKMTIFPRGSLHSMQNTGRLSLPSNRLFQHTDLRTRLWGRDSGLCSELRRLRHPQYPERPVHPTIRHRPSCLWKPRS
jgi:hypothetical protein